MTMLTSSDAVFDQGGIELSDRTATFRRQVQGFIAGLSSYAEQFFNRKLMADDYTEYFSGDNSDTLILNQMPVNSVTRVCVDDSGYGGEADNAFAASLDLVAGSDYFLKSGKESKGASGLLIRIGGVWSSPRTRISGYLSPRSSKSRDNILVEYNAGFECLPEAIVMMINAAVLRGTLNALAGGAVDSASYEDASVSYLKSSGEAIKLFGAIENVVAAYSDAVI